MCCPFEYWGGPAPSAALGVREALTGLSEQKSSAGSHSARTCCTLRVVKRASRMGSCGCCPHTFPGLGPAHSKLVLFLPLLFCKPCTSSADHPVSQRSGCYQQRQFRQAQSQCFRLFSVSQQLLRVVMARAYSGKALLPFLSPANWNVEGNQPLSRQRNRSRLIAKDGLGHRAFLCLQHSLPTHMCTHPQRNKSRALHITGLLGM